MRHTKLFAILHMGIFSLPYKNKTSSLGNVSYNVFDIKIKYTLLIINKVYLIQSKLSNEPRNCN